MPERQRALQADPRPVFQRLPRSRLYMGVFMTLFGIGMYGTTVGFYNMAVVSTAPHFYIRADLHRYQNADSQD